jgi:serine/threonine-protein kinase RsbW
MGNKKNKQFVIENRIEELPSLAAKIDEMAEEWKISPALAMNINLVIEEAVSNIIFYAFDDSNKHTIEISVSSDKKVLSVKITDDGNPFNPLEQQQPDITLPVEERPVGGLGIFLISQIMDEMDYARKENLNILTLNKTI